ncbi:MAG TPA: acyl-CoA dehydrogenase family protein [Solirubrobacterales bacterium]|nr:acyl-CoA dehydrogenase family protein [Solirubrobacterales bacterium]
MDLTLSPSEEAFRDEVRSWLEDNHPGEIPKDDDEAFEFARRWQRKLHEGGWAGVSWPEEYGGRGATLIEQAIFYEEMVRAKAPRVANVLGLVMGGPVVITHGTDEQKKRYLEPILSAEEIWCQGFSEPEAGSDLASLKTRAVKRNGGWVVSGQKVWTTLAHEAKWCMLVARTDPDAPKHQGLTYFLMDMEQDGVEVKPLVQITGEAEFNEIFMDEAYIPDENIVGGVGNGWSVAITTLMNERAGLAFAAQAALELAMSRAIELANETSRNGTSAAADPVVRDRLAQLFIESEIFRVTNLRGLTKIMKAGVPGPEGSLGKWHWAEINQHLMELAMEIEGPYFQFADESEHSLGGDWQYQYLRTRANSIEGGTTDILRNIVAERVLGLPKLR